MANKDDQQTITAGTNEIPAEVQAAIDAMLEEAKKKAEDIIAAAVEKADQITPVNAEQTVSGPTKEEIDRANELVKVKLFKDNGKYKDNVLVQVNGESLQIQRGVEVEIKRKFAEALENSQTQDEETARMCQGLADDFEKQSSTLA